jgi:hypothetical protein
MSNAQTDPRDEIDAKAGAAAPQLPANVDTVMPMILRAEIDGQIATARQYPRSVHAAIRNITNLATLDEETAAESLYALVRKKKQQNRNQGAQQDQENKAIEGPSIRLAEIAAQCWGNCRIEAHVVTVNRQEKYVEAVGTFHDLETNMASTATVRRNISTSYGALFSADMITVTGNAACAIAKRNAILAGIPRGVYRPAYQAARGIVAGTHATLSENREKAIKAFAAYGVTPAQIFEALDLEGEGDIKLDHIATLRAMFMSIKNGEATVEEMFAKPEKASADPEYNPLVKEKTDPATGEVTAESTATGGGNEVATQDTSNDGGQTRPADASATENRSAAAQDGGQAGATPATNSEATASTGAPTEGAEQSTTQQDLLTETSRPSEGNGEPDTPAGQTEGADGSRGNVPSAPDRLRSYSKALLSIDSGGPQKLGKQSEAWIKKFGAFDGADDAKRSKVYAVHVNRLTGSIDAAACNKQVEGIITA